MHEEHQYAVRAIQAGASGYLTKDSALAQLVDGDPQGGRGRRLHQRARSRSSWHSAPCPMHRRHPKQYAELNQATGKK